MPIKIDPNAGKVPDAPRNTWPLTLKEMPRGHKVMIEDLEIGERFGFAKNIKFNQLVSLERIGGDAAKRAKAALGYAKDWFQDFIRYDGMHMNDWVGARAKNAMDVKPDYILTRANVDTEWRDLAPQLLFLETALFSKIAVSTVGTDQHMQTIMNSSERQEFMQHFNEWQKRYDAKNDREFVPTPEEAEEIELKANEVTLDSLANIPEEDLSSFAKGLDIDAQGREGDELRSVIAQDLGLLDNIVEINQ